MSAKVPMTEELAKEYEQLFESCVVDMSKLDACDRIIDRSQRNRDRYESVSNRLGGTIPWWWIALTHQMERDQNFNFHLHNGDPLTARTVHVPAGRPKLGNPPFKWDVSAEDALRLRGLDKWSDWSISGVLYQFELYNGMGYRLYRGILSPYLWSGSNHYVKGKYSHDGKYDPELVSKQLGCGVVLRRAGQCKGWV
jgi:lysozyme family protein